MKIAPYVAKGSTQMALPTIGSRAADINAAAGGVADVLDLAARADNMHEKRATDKATANVLQSQSSFNTATTGKLNYSADEIPANANIRRTETVTGPSGEKMEVPRKNIPSYEVRAQLYKDSAQAKISAEADNVPLSRRENWNNRMTADMAQQYAAYAKQDMAAQRSEIRAQQRGQITQSVLGKDWKSASFLANTYPGTDSEKESLKNTISKQRESGGYSDSMSEGSVPKMQANLNYLENPKYAGKLQPAQRTAMVNQLKSGINQVNARNRSRRSAALYMLKQRGNRTVSALNRGDYVRPGEVSHVFQRVEQQLMAGDKSLESTYHALSEAIGDMDWTSKFRVNNQVDRQKFIDGLPTGTGDADYRKEKAIKLDRSIQRQTKDDTMTQGKNTGLVQVQPIDIDNLGETLEPRVKAEAQLRQTYGPTTGYLTKAEAVDLSSKLHDMPIQQKLDKIADVQNALGDDAPKLWHQLGDKRPNNTAMSGIMMAQGRDEAAYLNLRGAEYLKVAPMPAVKEDFLPNIYDIIGGAFSQSSTDSARRVQSVINVYAGLTQDQAGGAGGMSDILDEDRLKTAVHLALGSFISLGGSKVNTPSGLSGDDFDSFLRDVKPEYIGDVKGYAGHADDLKHDIRNGTVQLKQVADGRYFLMSTVTNSYLNRPDGSNAVLSYSPDAPLDTSHWYTGLERGGDALRQWKGGRQTRPRTPPPATSPQVRAQETQDTAVSTAREKARE